MARGRPPRGVPPRRPGRRGAEPDAGRAVRAWATLGAGALALLLLLWLGSRLLHGGDGNGGGPPTAPTGPTGASGAPYASPPPPGSVSATFPRPALGTRLEVKVDALGDRPSVCTAEGLLIGGDLRTVYHHRCGGEDFDRYYFLVEVTNRSGGRVPVTVEGFTVIDAGSETHEALPNPPPGAPATRFFPRSLTLGPGATLRRWVTIDGSDAGRPDRLVYTDGPERFIIRFRGTWR